MQIKYTDFKRAFYLLNNELNKVNSPGYSLIICGGSALYAAVDQFGGYHASDLEALNPTDEELVKAAEWSMSHDPSEGYRFSVKSFLKEFGYEKAAENI